jgi:lysyl-tRNA synthetase class I
MYQNVPAVVGSRKFFSMVFCSPYLLHIKALIVQIIMIRATKLYSDGKINEPVLVHSNIVTLLNH